MLKTNTTRDRMADDSDKPAAGHEARRRGSGEAETDAVGDGHAGLMGCASSGPAPQFFMPRPLYTDVALQQHMMQIRQHQFIQRHILEQQFHRSREILEVQHERQLSAFLVHQQHQLQPRADSDDRERHEKHRLELLKQKSLTEQSAVASPEVKRHLQEFVLQKKRKEAAASMGNLKIVPNAPPPPQPVLRKTASESNLLKMKNKRMAAAVAAMCAPYQRHGHASIPEGSEVSHVASSSNSSSPPIDLGSPSSLPQDLLLRSGVHGSAPTSPKTPLELAHHAHALHPRAATLAQALRAQQLSSASSLNSKSLPNIPTAVSRLAGKETGLLHKRKSPPPASSAICRQTPPHHGAMIVRRSKSSAILPLRKHLIEKSLQEISAAAGKKSVDEDQFYYQQKQLLREPLLIRPIEEVMEEDARPNESMDVDDDKQQQLQLQQQQQQQRLAHSFTARLGPSGLSPLVLSEVGISNDYVSRLLPQQPLDLIVMASNGTSERTGLGYDPAMLRHHCSCQSDAFHPENPMRIATIWDRLVATGLVEACVRVARKATLEEIQSCHSETHTLIYGTDMVNRCSLAGQDPPTSDGKTAKFCQLECGGVGVDADTYWNELETPVALRTAVGTLVELSHKVLRGELRNGFALIRPPGHHAEYEEAMGFCYVNSVAIAAKQLLLMPNVKRVLIIDWAIHHGNGTQKAFYDNPNVLYISLHRHDNGNFYPGTGSPVECGAGAGLGFNINIAWTGNLEPPMGDAEYLAAFRGVVMPVAKSFNPDIVLVSAGFDAAVGHPHPIGGYLVSTACFAYMTLQLRQLAAGKVVLALEGGYNLDLLGEATEQCMRALLGLPIHKIEEGELARRPCKAATETLQKTLAIQSSYWAVLQKSPETVLFSHLEAWERSREEVEALTAMASLSVETAAAVAAAAAAASVSASAPSASASIVSTLAPTATERTMLVQPPRLSEMSAPPAHVYVPRTTAIDLTR